MNSNLNGWKTIWPAPAKINLMLRITGKRNDGYHLLQTVFQLTTFNDWLRFYPENDSKIKLAKLTPGVDEHSDLIYRAAKLLQTHTNCKRGTTISLDKNIPMGGGLGGGSSNAATVLVALNKLWNLNLPKHDLIRLGLQLGADVPVFVFGHAAWAEGVGEELSQIEIPEKWLVIIKPDCHVDTGQIFSTKNLTRDSKSITMSDFLAGQHRNDCLNVVRKLYQPVEEALLDLSGFSESRLTGTGACVFAQFDSKSKAQTAFEALKNKWQVYLTQGVNRSPLYNALDTLTG